MRRVQLKRKILKLIGEREPSIFLPLLAEYPPQDLIGPLISGLCHPVESMRYHSIIALGRVVTAMAEDDREAARVVMRRFLWSLNDESGGIGWGAPEAMSEIMCHSSLLRNEYLHMLISYMREDGDDIWQDGNYLELPMLQRGLLWGVGRLCATFPELMIKAGVESDVKSYLKSEDFQVVGLALRCLSFLGVTLPAVSLGKFSNSKEVITFYEDDELQSVKLADLVTACIQA